MHIRQRSLHALVSIIGQYVLNHYSGIGAIGNRNVVAFAGKNGRSHESQCQD
jgi:hypothetical protein